MSGDICAMRWMGLLVLTLALAAPAWSSLAQADPRAMVGPWTTVAVNDPGTSAFAYCAAEADFADGITLGFARSPEGALNVALGYADPVLEAKRTYTVELVLDDGQPIPIEAFAPEPDILVLPTGQDRALHARLGRASLLAVEGGPQRLRLRLEDADAALAGLERCVRAASAPSGIEALPEAFRPLVRAAGIEDIRVMPVRDDPAAPIDAAFLAGSLFGGIKQLEPVEDEIAFAEVMLDYIDQLELRCPGEFEADLGLPITSEAGAAELSLATARLGCLHNQRATIAGLLFFQQGGPLNVIFLESPAEEGAVALAHRDTMAETLQAP